MIKTTMICILYISLFFVQVITKYSRLQTEIGDQGGATDDDIENNDLQGQGQVQREADSKERTTGRQNAVEMIGADWENSEDDNDCGIIESR